MTEDDANDHFKVWNGAADGLERQINELFKGKPRTDPAALTLAPMFALASHVAAQYAILANSKK
jgi:hypothetical protein